MLVRQPVDGLHGSYCAAAVGGHGGPGVAAEVLQAGHRFRGWGCAGIHAGLALSGLSPVGAVQSLLLGVVGAVVEGLFFCWGGFHVGLLVRELRGGAFVI